MSFLEEIKTLLQRGRKLDEDANEFTAQASIEWLTFAIRRVTVYLNRMPPEKRYIAEDATRILDQMRQAIHVRFIDLGDKMVTKPERSKRIHGADTIFAGRRLVVK